MKITQHTSVALPSRKARKLFPSWISLARAVAILAALILVFILGAGSQARGWLAPALNPRARIASSWEQSTLPTVYLDIKFEDAQHLKAQRDQARLTGVHIDEPGDAVSATLRIGGDTIPIQLSLPQGTVEQSKAGWWAFDVLALDGQRVLGYRHLRLSPFSLSQFGLSQSLQHEGILAAAISPVQVELNGDDLGAYGAWPAPGSELVVQQGRPASSVVYFDQSLYWQDLQRQRGDGPAPTSVNLADCQVASIAVADASGTPANAKAAALLRDLQNGRPASDVMDVEQIGTLLALATLWQGAPLDDWTNLAFYFNPAANQLEPVVPANLISANSGGALRWPACFDDPLFQSAYVQAVEHVSQPEYLQQLRAALGDAFDKAQLMVWTADGQPELTWNELAARQARMARWLEPTQAVLATWTVPITATPGAVVQVRLSNLTRAPVEVLGFDVGKSTFLPIDPAWIQDDAGAVVQQPSDGLVLRAAADGRLQALVLAVPYDKIFSARRAVDEPMEMRVVTRLWGLTRQQSAPMQLH
jgi:hypothetical protein